MHLKLDSQKFCSKIYIMTKNFIFIFLQRLLKSYFQFKYQYVSPLWCISQKMEEKKAEKNTYFVMHFMQNC
jgi:hypothetical protein